MNFFDLIKGVYRRLFPVKDIKTALGIESAVTEEMRRRIILWGQCYAGRAPWLGKDDVSLRLEQSITREFSTIVLNEMSTSISNPKLEEIFNKATRNLGMNLQRALGVGGMCIKPLGGDKVQYVTADEFVPVEFNTEGRMIKVVFPDFKKLGNKYYTRLEYHDADPVKGLTIINKAFVSASADILGRPVELSAVEEWAKLPEIISYPLMLRPPFGYYRNPLDNVIDDSFCGVSIFNSALGLIRKADTQFGRLDYEFESARRKIHADLSLIKKTDSGIELDDIYVDVNGDSDDFYKEFSPSLRQDGFIAGLEEYKRNIEFEVGLSYGDISNPQTIAKTATEIKSAKDRKFNTVKAIQDNLRDCLDDLVFALAFYNSLTLSGYKFNCDFKDSILADEGVEREEDRKDLANGTLRPEEYRAKWRNESLAAAKNNLPKAAEVD